MPFSERFHAVRGAQSTFADRSDEQSAFDTALACYVSQIHALQAGAWRADDPAAPRGNVMTYYGVGGIGKTTLLRKLADRLDRAAAQPAHWPPPMGYASPCASLTWDMSDFDPEDAFLALRASVATLPGDFPAFDLCLARYWWQRHGDATVAETFQRRGRLAGAGSAVGLGDQIQAAMEEIAAAVLGSAVPGIAAFRGLSHAGSALWRRHLEKSTLRNCLGLEDLLAEPANATTLPYYACALAWDLARLQLTTAARLVVFIDTFEEADQRAAAFLNRAIWMLPNALFIIAGRNVVTWARPSAELEFSGPQRWPTLHAGTETELRQHLVGFLSLADSRTWLRQRLGESCTADIIELAARESQGLPVHLDLIAQHVLEVAARREIIADDVRGDLNIIARRVLRDLSAPQRQAALAASLYRWFDDELLRVTAGLPTGGPNTEVTSQPYVEKLHRLPYPFRLHDLLRHAFRSATDLGDDQWLAADWERAARRGAELLRERLLASTEPSEFQEHAELLFTLVATFGFDDDWLVDLSIRLTTWSVGHSQWRAESLSGLPAADNWSTALAAGLAIVMNRQVHSRDEVARHLTAVVSGHPEDERLDVLRYFLGQAQRDAGRTAESAATLEGMRDGRLRAQALKGLSHLHRRTGNFAAARALLAANVDVMEHPTRIGAEIAWTEGQVEEAAQLFLVAAEQAATDRDLGEQALCLASAAWCRALLLDDPAARSLVADTRKILRHSYQSFADILAGIAEGLIYARSGGSLALLAEGEAAAARVGHSSLVAYARFARCLALLGPTRSPQLTAALSQLADSVDGLSFAYLQVIASELAGASPTTTRWRDPAVLARWQNVIGQEKTSAHG